MYFNFFVFVVMCPKADDPFTVDQNDRAILLVVKSNNSVPLQGLLGIKLYGSTSYISLSVPSNSHCQAQLESSDQIGTALCNHTVVSDFEHSINVTFTSWPSYTPDNNIYVNDGNPLITDFFCDASLAVNTEGTLCFFSDLQKDDIKG